MKIEETILKNGAKIIGVKMPGVKSIVINFGFRTGSRNEEAQYAGISHFLEHMMFKGSQKRPTTMDISKQADSIGALYNAFTGKEYTCYYIKTNFDHFDIALDIVGDMVTRPLLKEPEIRKECGTVIEEIKMYNDNPMLNIHGKMEETLYGTNTANGRDIAGKQKTVKAINSKIMKNYFNNTYNGSNCTLVIAGNLPEDYQLKAQKYLNRFPKGKISIWERPTKTNKGVRVLKKETDQAHFGLCFPAYPLTDRRRYAAEVLAIALGGYMSSRLFTEIREKRGWAYRIWASNNTNSDNGYIGIYGGIKKEKMLEATKLIQEEVIKFGLEYTQEEIDRAKNFLSGFSTIHFDDPEEKAKFLILTDLLTGRPETPEEYVRKIKKVTSTELKEVAQETFTGKNLSLTIIGPYKNNEKFAKILNQ